MSFPLPFTALSLLHSNLTRLVSTNDDKYDFVDSNKIPYSIRFNKHIANYFTVADENGSIRIFKSYPKLKIIKEFSAQKSCIYDLQWLNSFEIACGGGDQFTTLYDMNTCTRLAVLKGHTESVKSIAVIPQNQFVIATGSRDGSILIFDTRFNRTTNQTDTNNEQQQVSNIRSVNSIQPAHFIDNNNNNNNSILAHKSNRSTNNTTTTTHTNLINSNILKSKSSNQTSSNTTIMKRPSPVASVLFQNDNYLVSAGATDGLIKVWDIRKIHTSKKQTVETFPVYIFDNQPLPTSSSSLTTNNNNSKSTNKGYSNLIFNSSRTRLYANCMNGQLYEYNFSTYNNHMHTRSLSACSPNHSLVDEHNKPKLSYHTNQSNFIKSSLSQCENFILTGSSDFNAYLYSTNVNCMVNEFKEKMPVIMLKGHTNEVTCVDWNPFDSNQLVTCSDDNTMRVWNVRRDMCEEKSNECNFSIAETCKYDNNDKTDLVSINQFKYNSSIRYSKRLYNRYMPNVTGIYDDHLFVNYEYKNFIKTKFKQIDNNNQQNTVKDIDMDIENELCLKCQNISIDTDETSSKSSSNSPISQNLKQIENELSKRTTSGSLASSNENNYNFKYLETFLSDLPINIIEIPTISTTTNEMMCSLESISSNESQQFVLNNNKNKLIDTKNTFSLLLSSSSSSSSNNNKPIIKRRIKEKTSPNTKLKTTTTITTMDTSVNTPLRMLGKNSVSTTKKRSWDSTSSTEILNSTDIINNNNNNKLDIEPKTPKTKRRLIMSTTNQSMLQSPSTTTNGTANSCNNIASPKPNSKTILHYFSPVIQPK